MLEVDQSAPDFTLPDQEGQQVTLSELKGKPVVVYFYPKDDTPGCTTQACAIRDQWSEFEEAGAVVLGISPDDVDSHKKFAGKYDLPHRLLADPDHEAIGPYGAWGTKKMYGNVRVEEPSRVTNERATLPTTTTLRSRVCVGRDPRRCLAVLQTTDGLTRSSFWDRRLGQRVPAVEKYIAGYQAGARRANPRVATLNTYTDDFVDSVKGRSVALSQIAKGSRVVFQVAGACGLGALEAAKEHGVWGIGVDVDQSHLGRHILTSAVKSMDVAVFDTIEELVRGTLETGRTSRFSLRNGGVGLGTISARVPRSLKAAIEDVRAEIVAGKIPIATSVT